MAASNGWKFNPETKHLSHPNGLCLKIEGRFGVIHNMIPIIIPDSLGAIELAQSIRQAMEHYPLLTKTPATPVLNQDTVR